MLLNRFLLVASLWCIGESSKVPKCTGITYTADFMYCNFNEAMFSASFDLNVKYDNQNPLFPNILTYSNFTSTNYGNDYYYNMSVDDFRIGEWAVGGDYTWFPIQQPIYEVNFPNVFAVQVLDYFAFEFMSLSVISFYINNGEFITEKASFVFDNPCATYEDLTWCVDDSYNFKIITTICCNGYDKVEIPDLLNKVCEEYESETIITEADNTTTYISANFHLEDSGFNIAVTNFTSFYYISYYLIASSLSELRTDQACQGNDSSPTKFCIKSFPIGDFQFHFQFALNTKNDSCHFNPIIGKMQRRNGLFLKDNYQPFTSDDPCWTENGKVPFYDGLKVNKSFCCTKFKIVYTGSTTMSSPTTTTTTGSNSGSCKKYQSQTELSDKSIYLEVEYLLNSTGINAAITDYFTSNKAASQLEVFSADTFSNVCRVTEKQPTNICFFGLSQIHQYELQLRTSTMPEGFNMTVLIEKNGQFVTPFLTPSTPCENETHPYNYGNSQIFATTKFCCTAFN